MAQTTLSSVFGFLEEKELLTPTQVQQLSANGQPLDLAAFLREAVRRQWLTTYQANRIAAGHADELIVGAYCLLEPIGEGGMGKVFKARHVRMDRIVGLKIIPEEYLGNAAAVSRFYREIRAVAQLSHPNIVTAYEANQEGRTHYLAMEFLDGIDLAKLVKQSGPLPVSQACDFIRQAALGLQHAHEKGLVHRDIKPGNIMAARSSHDGTPVIKVLDFGLARLDTNQPATRLTKVGSVLGTVDYMSPEQANDATVDIRSDIYSLGCSLFYLLAGRAPFPGKDAVGCLVARVITDAPAIGTLRKDVPVGLEKVLAKMLARDPAERIQTPVEAAMALKPFGSTVETVGPNPTARTQSLPKANASALPSDQAETISQSKSDVASPVPRRSERVKVAAREDFKDLISTRPSPSRKKGSKRPLIAIGIGMSLLTLLIALLVGGFFRAPGGHNKKEVDGKNVRVVQGGKKDTKDQKDRGPPEKPFVPPRPLRDVPELREALRRGDNGVRQAALDELAALSREQPAAIRPALPELLDCLKQDDSKLRMSAALILGNTGGPEAAPAVPILVEVLRDGSLELKRQTAAAISKIGPHAAATVGPMIDLLTTSDAELRRALVAALGNIGPQAEAAVPTMVRLLLNRTEHKAVRREAGHALHQIGAPPESVPKVLELIANPKEDPDVRWRAAWILRGHKQEPGVADTLATVLREPKRPEANMLRYDCAYHPGNHSPHTMPAA